jgi:hypothetical protein
MPYLVGIDVGTRHTSAALCRLGGPASGAVETVRLGPRSNAVASTLYLPGDGSVVVGEVDPRLALTEPHRLVRGFSRRVGDDVPFVVDGGAYSAEELTAALVVWVADQIAEREGGPADHVVVTHPASWGAYRRNALWSALRQVELVGVTLLPEPIAVGECYARHETLDAGDALAMYGLGGDWCYAAVIRRTDSGAFALAGHAEEVEPGGGEQVDDAVLDWLRAQLADPLRQLDPADPQTALVTARLRQECRAAKERLSVAPETVVDVRLPRGVHQPTLTRQTLDGLVRPMLIGTVDTLLRAVRSSGVEPGQLAALALVGGAVRMPLVAELVSAQLPCRIAVEDDPQATAAIGAALVAYRRATGGDPPAAARPSGALVLAGGARTGRDPVRAVPPDLGKDPSVHFPTEILQPATFDDDDQPPPRPPAEIVALDLPRRRTLNTLIPGAGPAVTGLIAVVLAGAIVAVTFVVQAGTSNRGSSFTGGNVQGGTSAPTVPGTTVVTTVVPGGTASLTSPMIAPATPATPST